MGADAMLDFKVALTLEGQSLTDEEYFSPSLASEGGSVPTPRPMGRGSIP